MTNVKSRKTRKAYTPEEAALFAKAANAAAKQVECNQHKKPNHVVNEDMLKAHSKIRR
ncbi:hypothetical protein [Vibrio coralliilyticus]|uniref:hypothetical protein n=1 Tax=Vibrio coralliilyticus TaxID=190893 RepID=UPI000A3E1B46|nr:hypothetical protein [Vibrio coralliilyticus]